MVAVLTYNAYWLLRATTHGGCVSFSSFLLRQLDLIY